MDVVKKECVGRPRARMAATEDGVGKSEPDVAIAKNATTKRKRACIGAPVTLIAVGRSEWKWTGWLRREKEERRHTNRT